MAVLSMRGREMDPNIWRILMLVGIVVFWFVGVLLFIVAVLLVVGVFGNGYPRVIEFMNCDSPNAAVSCARVYGFRTEGVVVFILSFFFFGWAIVFTLSFLMRQGRVIKGKVINKPPQAMVLSRPPQPSYGGQTHMAQFATSEA